MSEKKGVGRNVAIALGIICVILAVGLVGAVANYTLIISGKDNTITAKNSQIQTLTNQKTQLQVWLEGNLSQINALNAQTKDLQNQVSSLNLQKSQLQTWLDGNKTLLNQTQQWLQENITYYESQVDTLDSQITSLQNQITNLNAQIRDLQAEYNHYVTAYQSLRDKVNQRWNQINVEPFITPQDQAVHDIVYSITGGWSNPSDWDEYWTDVKAMYDWVINNIEYRYDGLYPILPDTPYGNLDFWDEMWQFPNETLSLMKGDCEDQAILLCSMIRCYSDLRYFAEVIIIESSTSGHAAVQMPVEGDKFVILDSAGNYYTHDFGGNISPTDISQEINNWLNYWKPEMGNDVYVDRIFSDYIDKTFTSTNDYISWMYSR